MSMSDHTIIAVIEEDETGIKKSSRVDKDADTCLDHLDLVHSPGKFVFVEEVRRKLKKRG